MFYLLLGNIFILTIQISHYYYIIITLLLLQYVRNEYSGWIEDKAQRPTFTIGGEAITLDLQDCHDTKCKNWNIEPLTPPEVKSKCSIIIKVTHSHVPF